MKIKDNSVIKKLVTLGQSSYVCLCAPYLRMMGVDKGDQVKVSFEDGEIVIRAVNPRKKRV